MNALSRQPRYSREETARRGNEIYERDIQPLLVDQDENWFVAIDVETGDYEIAPDELSATDALFVRHPEARIWMRRVGSRYVYRFGYHRKMA